jgi:hypothetical protein
MPRIISIQLLVNDFGNLGSHIQQAHLPSGAEYAAGG